VLGKKGQQIGFRDTNDAARRMRDEKFIIDPTTNRSVGHLQQLRYLGNGEEFWKTI